MFVKKTRLKTLFYLLSLFGGLSDYYYQYQFYLPNDTNATGGSNLIVETFTFVSMYVRLVTVIVYLATEGCDTDVLQSEYSSWPCSIMVDQNYGFYFQLNSQTSRLPMRWLTAMFEKRIEKYLCFRFSIGSLFTSALPEVKKIICFDSGSL